VRRRELRPRISSRNPDTPQRISDGKEPKPRELVSPSTRPL